MPRPLTQEELRQRQEQAQRVRFLLDDRWGGNQNRMAADLPASTSVVSKIVRGERVPGRKFLEKLARVPGVNGDWVRQGAGEPYSVPAAGALPVTVGILPGWPERHADLLTGERHPVASAFERPSRYWLRVAPDCPLARNADLAVLAGDLLMFDANRDLWASSLSSCQGRLFGVRLPGQPPGAYAVGRLGVDGVGLFLDLFGQTVRVADPQAAGHAAAGGTSRHPSRRPRRVVRRVRRGEQQAGPAAQGAAEPGRPASGGASSQQGQGDGAGNPPRVTCTTRDLVAIKVYLVRP